MRVSPSSANLVSLVPAYLLQEIHHRMANSMAILAATLRSELTEFRDAELKRAIQRCEKQILAVSELNRFLGTNWAPNDLTAENYFQALCALLSRSLLAPLGIRCEAFVTNGQLSCERRGYLAVILVELVTNAAKHAFRGQVAGCVRIEIEAGAAQWSVTVMDNGQGFERLEKGTGSKIVDSLVETLGAELIVETDRQGTRVSIALHI
jgi:two-component sensor histidine kinase